MNSANADVDRENAAYLQYIQALNRPYVIALSKQNLPNARTPQQMREALAIPEDIKVLSYKWKDPKTARQVVLDLVELFPRDALVKRVIEGLTAKIEEA
jgi:signal recognition particle receptor subunit beta